MAYCKTPLMTQCTAKCSLYEINLFINPTKIVWHLVFIHYACFHLPFLQMSGTLCVPGPLLDARKQNLSLYHQGILCLVK